MNKKFWIRRGFYVAVMLVIGILFWVQARPEKQALDLNPCEETLTLVYRDLVPAGTDGKMPSIVEGNRKMLNGYYYLGYTPGTVAPMVVEKFGRHAQDSQGRYPVCFLLSNGKVMVWFSKSDNYAFLAEELKRLYPDSGEMWAQAMGSIAR